MIKKKHIEKFGITLKMTWSINDKERNMFRSFGTILKMTSSIKDKERKMFKSLENLKQDKQYQ